MKKILVMLFSFILILNLASALDTEIKLKTPEFTEVNLAVTSPSSIDVYNIYKKTSDAYGDVTFTYSGDELAFDLNVLLKKGGQIIYEEKFDGDYKAGKSIYLEVIPEGYELLETPSLIPGMTNNSTNLNATQEVEESNESESNETQVPLVKDENIAPSEKPGVSGLFTSEGGIFSSKTIIYIIGLILVMGILFFTTRLASMKKPSTIKVTKLSEMRPSNEDNEAGISSTIKSAEDNIRQAQEELNSLKKGQKLKELKERIAKDQEELRRLSK